MAITRRYVVHGRMPLPRTPQSGLFTTRFKEDAFFLDFDEQNILFNEGARTEQALRLPLFYIDRAYYEIRKSVETLGLDGAGGRIEAYIQYAKLPLLDPQHLDALRQEIINRGQIARETYVAHQNHQALFSLLRLQLCDEPIVYFEYNRNEYSLDIKARIPKPPTLPDSTRTKRGRINFFREYEDRVCSKAVAYVLAAFETLPFLQEISITLTRMESRQFEGLMLFDEQQQQKKLWQLRRNVTPEELQESPKERKKREAAEKKQLIEQEREDAKRKREMSKSRRQLEMTSRSPDEFDELFDGSLIYENNLLAARIPRQGFMDLSKSKMSYSARRALEQFSLRLIADEEEATFAPIEPYFEPKPLEEASSAQKQEA